MNIKFLNPSFLFLLFLEAIIIILYLIKPKRLRIKVPSLILWEKTIEEKNLGRWFKKLPKNLLLLFQLLILFFLVLSLSKPILSLPSIGSKPTIIILDSSASMASRDILPSRFQKAKSEIINLIKRNPSPIKMIIAKDKPEVILNKNEREIEKELEREKVFIGEGNLEESIRKAESLSKGIPHEIHIFTDGSDPISIPKDSTNRYFLHIIGRESFNIGILDGRIFPKNENVYEIFLKIGNFSQKPQEFNLRIMQDNNKLKEEKIRIDPKEIKVVKSEIPKVTGKIVGEIDEKDFLEEDNKAFFYIPIFSPKVLLVTLGNPFLEKALRSIPNLKLDIRKDFINIDLKNYNFYIFDGLIPYADISGNFLFIGGYPGINPQNIEKIGKVKILSWEDHPITRFLQLYGISIDNAYTFKDENLKPLIYSDKGPVAYIYEKDNSKGIVLSFDLLSSSFIYSDSFPIFIYNLLRYYLSYDPQKRCDNYMDSPGFKEYNGYLYAVNIFSQKESDISKKINIEIDKEKDKKEEKGFIQIDLSKPLIFLVFLLLILEIFFYQGGKYYS
uniref:VWA domain-containing protein n=1 Tax=Dictyoglomus turgidum TaxID=513050 RepID=A0A7C3SNL9_9BACT